jgi:hypothetical protein
VQVRLCCIRVSGLRLSTMLDYRSKSRATCRRLDECQYLSDDSASDMSYDKMSEIRHLSVRRDTVVP